MSKATQASNTSRRAMLAGLVTLPMAGSVQAMARPDAHLISLCDEFIAVRSQLDNRSQHPIGSTAYLAELAREEDLCSLDLELLDRISQISAQTMLGINAKAKVIQVYLPDHIADCEMETEQPEVQLVFSLLQDIAMFATEARA
ncbi:MULTISPECIES: hypothetical protein [unclassified Gluconobacter]|uniref:hypothetical protein n=1 Tax=unclassified Gluconobacter TaxID=2644261 RepID=UPI001C05C387|nr:MULTISPECIES: hypothetical protein [unclassified Gluconobacter]